MDDKSHFPSPPPPIDPEQSSLSSSSVSSSRSPSSEASPSPKAVFGSAEAADQLDATPTEVLQTSQPLTPQPVVQVLSPRGVEYVFLAITLFMGATGLVTALLALVNGQTSFSVLSFPTAMLLISVPIFSFFFLRLKAAELKDPSLRLDASKRRTTQLIQIASFLVCIFTLIGLLMVIFSKMSGDYDGSLVKACLNALVILVVAGGILAYYWRDEHRSV